MSYYDGSNSDQGSYPVDPKTGWFVPPQKSAAEIFAERQAAERKAAEAAKAAASRNSSS